MSRLLCAGVLAAFLAACGHKASPIPPTPRVPLRPLEVRWHQRGGELEIQARYDLRRKGGAELRGQTRPVVLAFLTPTQDMARGWGLPSRDREFARLAQVFPLDPFPAESHREQVVRTEHLSLEAFGDAKGVVLALAVEDQRGRSMGSPRYTFLPARPALKEPVNPSLTPEETQLRITWTPPEDSRVDQIRIYRRQIVVAVDSSGGASANQPGQWIAIATNPAAAGLAIDTDAQYGQHLEYAITSTTSSEGVAIESRMVFLPALVYRDLFPPLPAQDLEAVAESDKIRVLWFPGGSADEARTLVERQSEGEASWDEIGSVEIPDADYVDTSVEPGQRYRYRVISVDGQGNRATPSEISPWIAVQNGADRSLGSRENG